MLFDNWYWLNYNDYNELKQLQEILILAQLPHFYLDQDLLCTS